VTTGPLLSGLLGPAPQARRLTCQEHYAQQSLRLSCSTQTIVMQLFPVEQKPRFFAISIDSSSRGDQLHRTVYDKLKVYACDAKLPNLCHIAIFSLYGTINNQFP